MGCAVGGAFLDSPRGPEVRTLLFTVAVLAALFALTILSSQPPSPKPADAPLSEFSAVRAIAILHRVIGADIPHPIGSPANDEVRGRIVAELTQQGYQPQVQAGFACSQYGQCATVRNVVARLDGTGGPGSASGPDGVAVLLTAHYDSVPAGPGDSDDGTGVAAVLESSRALKAGPQPRHSIVFLIDDGEEAGLLGARAFVDSHPWAREVRAAVNLDARGTSGPSLMFETGAANEWAVRLYAQNALRPATNSILYTAYKQLPNDTDFTVFKEAGYQGLNFAFIGGVEHYHTPLDNSANVTLASLQHQGENGLASVKAVANSSLSDPPARAAVYFTLFQRLTFCWWASRSLFFAVIVALLLAAELAWMIRRHRISLMQVGWGKIAWLVITVVAGVLALILRRLLFLAGATPVNWAAHPAPLQIAFWFLAIAVVVTHSLFFASRAGYWGLWFGIWIWWTLAALLTAWLAPGLSYFFLVPSLVALLSALPEIVRPDQRFLGPEFASALPSFAAAILGFPLATSLYTGLGARGLILIALVVACILTPMSPLCANLRGVWGTRKLAFVWIPIFIGAAAIFGAIVVPAYSAKSPQRLNIEYWADADSGKAQWVVVPDSGHLPEPMRVAADFVRTGKNSFPWDSATSFVADAPRLQLAPPTFTILESSESNGRRMLSALLRSERGAPRAMVLFPPDSGLDAVRIEGQPMQPENARVRQRFNGWIMYGCPALPATGIQIDFSLPSGKSVEVLAADESYGLVPEGAFLLNARPLTATRSQDGDVTIVSRRVQLNP
jgi:hypothetical protein